MAEVSGPGAYSQRTDLGATQAAKSIPAQSYGDATDFQQIQQGAPMAASPDVRPMPPSQVAQGAPAGPSVPFGAPTTMPDQPVTAGAPVGPGPGPEALGLPNPQTNTYMRAIDVLHQLSSVEPQNSEVAALLNRVRTRGL